MIKRREGIKYVAPLPEGEGWELRVMRDRLVAVHPDHPPVIVEVKK